MTTNRSNQTILDALCLRAGQHPDRAAYHLLSDDATVTDRLTWAELDRRARALAGRIAAKNARGERAILLYPSGLDYITALYACLYAGVIAVPAYPPRMNRSLSRILSIVEDCAPKFVLTDSTVLAGIHGVMASNPALQGLQWIATDTLDLTEDSRWSPDPASADEPAFLQCAGDD